MRNAKKIHHLRSSAILGVELFLLYFTRQILLFDTHIDFRTILNMLHCIVIKTKAVWKFHGNRLSRKIGCKVWRINQDLYDPVVQNRDLLASSEHQKSCSACSEEHFCQVSTNLPGEAKYHISCSESFCEIAFIFSYA